MLGLLAALATVSTATVGQFTIRCDATCDVTNGMFEFVVDSRQVTLSHIEGHPGTHFTLRTGRSETSFDIDRVFSGTVGSSSLVESDPRVLAHIRGRRDFGLIVGDLDRAAKIYVDNCVPPDAPVDPLGLDPSCVGNLRGLAAAVATARQQLRPSR